MLTEATAMTVVGKVFEKTAPTLISGIAKKLGTTTVSLRVRYTITFSDHLKRTLGRIYTVKTVISKDSPVNLQDIYVSLNTSCNGKVYSDQDLVNMLTAKCRAFIVGTGGAGKTMMMKYLVLSSIGNPSGTIPIFLEFRNLKLESHDSIEKAAYAQVAKEGAEESYELFIAGLEEGLFTIFLDGLDEIGREAREDVTEKVNIFARKYEETSIVLSSRPGFSTQSFDSFFVYEVQGLTLDQAVEVIQKTPADVELKGEFIKQLKSTLFEKHQTFLQIPLLDVMMLLTFSSYADIPDRMTVFYEQAFDTLYALHDTTSKGAYKRPHFANLSPDLFRKFFEAFCYITLSKDKFDFVYNEIIEFITQALAVSQIEALADLVQRDLEESVCLVQQDGIKYVFVHRSFQEYFAAKFALRYSGNNQYDILANCIGLDWSNNTIYMLNEIDPIKLREKWILPSLHKLAGEVSSTEGKPLFERLASMIGGYHFLVTSDADNEARTIFYGFLAGERSVIRDLSMALSRVSSFGSIYNALGKTSFQKTELETLASSMKAIPEDIQNLLDAVTLVHENPIDEDGDAREETRSVRLIKENEELFHKLGVELEISKYLKSIQRELKRVDKLVQNQRKLELQIL